MHAKHFRPRRKVNNKKETNVCGEQSDQLARKYRSNCRYRCTIDSVSWIVKHKSSNNKSSCAFEIAIIEQSYYHIYRRLKSKRVRYLELHSVRCINRPDLVLSSVELGKIILRHFWIATHKLDSSNESLLIKLFYFSYGI